MKVILEICVDISTRYNVFKHLPVTLISSKIKAGNHDIVEKFTKGTIKPITHPIFNCMWLQLLHAGY